MIEAIVPAAAGIVGIILGGGLRALEAKRARNRETAGLLSALVAEVEAISRLARHRGFYEGISALHDHAAAMVADGRGEEPCYVLQIAMQHDYFVVFDHSVARLGLLEPFHADRITRFYALARATLENYHPDSPFQRGATASDVEKFTLNDLMLLRTVHALGELIAGFRMITPPVAIGDAIKGGHVPLPPYETSAEGKAEAKVAAATQ